ncbi:hypothetical protein ACH5RR_013189 [Cinchona calisaya]|uniref:Uncharacterized protein n=1 Tax=Cinchona calisaya TaxID=153742 RepID=A0ABD2ZZG3_9GENT
MISVRLPVMQLVAETYGRYVLGQGPDLASSSSGTKRKGFFTSGGSQISRASSKRCKSKELSIFSGVVPTVLILEPKLWQSVG